MSSSHTWAKQSEGTARWLLPKSSSWTGLPPLLLLLGSLTALGTRQGSMGQRLHRARLGHDAQARPGQGRAGQAAHLAKVLVQHLDEAVDELQDAQLVLRRWERGRGVGRREAGAAGAPCVPCASVKPSPADSQLPWGCIRVAGMFRPPCSGAAVCIAACWAWAGHAVGAWARPATRLLPRACCRLTSWSSTPTMKKSDAYRL